jgi:hypothetical protein
VPGAEADPEIARQVLFYFMRNPQAADSLEGIARWRLLEERLQRSLQQTDAAVKWLVMKGYLQEIRPVGCVQLYRLDPKRQDEAAKFLAANKALKRRATRTH